jgi:fatty-acid desaturase
MTRYRPWRWIAITLLVATLLGTVTMTVEAWADRGAHRCASTQRFAAEGNSWRKGAIAAASCDAWRRMHRRQHRFLDRLDLDG